MMPESFLDGRVTLWHGDCLDVLPGIGTVDHFIFDPRYFALAKARVESIGMGREEGARHIAGVMKTVLPPESLPLFGGAA